MEKKGFTTMEILIVVILMGVRIILSLRTFDRLYTEGAVSPVRGARVLGSIGAIEGRATVVGAGSVRAHAGVARPSVSRISSRA